MSTMKLNEHIYSVGVQNPALRVFDIIMQTEYGTSYNAYLVKGSEKTALIETVHLSFFDEYLENLQSITALDQIDYLILNHTEPDHSGSVRKLLEVCPKLKVIATMPGHKYLSGIANMSYDSITAKEGESIDLGGVTLKFIPAPMLHWPDSMFTWCEEEKTVFSCDFLGAHYCEPRMLDTKITYRDKYESAFQFYYQAIFGPFKPFVLAGLDKLEALGAETVCTSHGPVLTETIPYAVKKYREWSEVCQEKNDPKQVSIFYVSAYGCTRRLAEEIKTVLTAQGIIVSMHDVIHTDLSGVAEEINRCDGLLLGTPTINRDALKPIWDVTTLIDAVTNKGKAAAVFGSYGWSGEGVPMIVERLKGLKLKVVGDGLKVNFVPSEEELQSVREFAAAFAENL